ncbi:MAG: 2-polyprenylphenol 6-hydroxylase [Gammaproteobacteria bacterium]
MFNDTRRLLTIFSTWRQYGMFRLLSEKLGIPSLKYLNLGVTQQRYSNISEGERVRLAFQQLGPIFIKLGQALSTRPDLIPADIAESLMLLQDKVPAFPTETAIVTIESSLKKPIQALFSEFEAVPIGSASIAQVHGATLHSGERVVVKVLRPDIEAIIARDIRMLYTLSRWTSTWVPQLAVLRLHEVVSELDTTLSNELDLIRECANGSVLKRNLADMPNVKIPQVYWDYTSTRVATMERIHGTCIGDKEALLAQGVDLPALAEAGVKLFFTQVFHHRYFHADMHPGNVFINTDNILDPQFILVDFGIMGTLSAFDQTYLAQNLLAFIHRDYRRVAELHIESGWVPKTVRLDSFEAAIRTVCEPMFERPIKDISFGKLLMRLFQTAQQFEMRIQPQLLLLQKTILNVEGITRHLYPELNVWETARPVIESWMKERMGAKAAFKSIKKQLPYWIASFPDLPEKFMKAFT